MANRFFPNFPSHHVCSAFGPRVLRGVPGFHSGIDLVAKAANGDHMTDEITAHTGGVVDGCGYESAGGNYVRIRVSERTTMSYCHFRDPLPWKKGDIIEAGTVLGYMGSTGNSTGAHLHWGIKRDGEWIDPAPYLDADYTEDQPTPAPQETKTQTCAVILPILRRGDTGAAVEAMQALLDLRGYPCGEKGVDGIFGADTETALKYFQAERDLESDAICGPLTWAEVLMV